MVPFGLQGASSLLMRVKNQALTVGLDFPSSLTPTPAIATTAAGSKAAPSSPAHDRPAGPRPPQVQLRAGRVTVGSRAGV